MGVGIGGSYNSQSSSSASNSTENKTFSAPQTSLQDALGSSLMNDTTATDSGKLTPGVTAMKTAAADQINKTSGGLGDRIGSFLAARGFGKSGTTGKAALQTELGRQSDLATNESNFAGVQQTANSSNLLAALNYAFTQMGQTAAGTSTGSSSGFGVSAGAGIGFKPV